MMELTLIVICGVLAGMTVGLLAGIGPSLVLLTVLPWLYELSLLNVFVFYFSMMATSQFFASVVGITYGIAGDITAVPAAQHGHQLFLAGQGTHALAYTSTASLVGNMSALLVLVLVAQHAEIILPWFSNTVLSLMFFAIVAILIAMQSNPLLSLIALISGLLVGRIGFDNLSQTHVLVPAHTSLDSGLPFIPVFIGFLAIPMLIQQMQQPKSELPIVNFAIDTGQRLAQLVTFAHWPSVIRGSLVGLVAGLVPGVSYMISSNLADRWESRHNDQAMPRLLAAESANNAGGVIVLLPLLLFAMPIVVSEAIVLGVAHTKGFAYSSSADFLASNWQILLTIMLTVTVINWLIAGSLYDLVVSIYIRLQKWIYTLIMTAAVAVCVVVAWQEQAVVLYLSVLGISLVVGLLIKNIEIKLIGVYGFFVSGIVLDEWYRFYLINFT